MGLCNESTAIPSSEGCRAGRYYSGLLRLTNIASGSGMTVMIDE